MGSILLGKCIKDNLTPLNHLIENLSGMFVLLTATTQCLLRLSNLAATAKEPVRVYITGEYERYI
jgi:hypothetical protein